MPIAYRQPSDPRVSSQPSLPCVQTYRHDHTRNRHIRRQALPDARTLPKRSKVVRILVAIHDPREDVVGVGRRADGEEDDEEERLEVEEGSLAGGLAVRGGAVAWSTHHVGEAL